MIFSREKNKLLLLLCIISTLVAFFVLFNDSGRYAIMSLLPFSFLLGTQMYAVITKDKSIGIGSIVLFCTYFIRNVIISFTASLSGYLETLVGYDYNLAISIMSIETVLALFFMALTTKNLNKNGQQLKLAADEEIDVDFLSKKSRIIFLIIVLITAALTLIYPRVLNVFKIGMVSGADLTEHYIAYYSALNSMPKLIFYLVTWMLSLIKHLLCLLIIIKIKKSKIIKFKFLISSIVVLLFSLIMTDTNADSLIFAIIFFCLLLMLYKNKRKVIIYGVSILGTLFVGIGLLSTSSSSFSTTRTLNAYFGGVGNVSYALGMKDFDTAEAVKADFLRSLPIIKALFVDMNSSTTIFNQSIKAKGQIIPAIGQSYIYFGVIFSPIISVVFAVLTVICESKIYNKNRIMDIFLILLLTIRFSCVPILYNLYIFYIGFFNSYLPIRVLYGRNPFKAIRRNRNE